MPFRTERSLRVRFLILRRREQPLVHDNAEIGFQIAKREPHFGCRVGAQGVYDGNF